LQPDLYPDLYKEATIRFELSTYLPRGDAKEGRDNIDIFGWLGYAMQIKVNCLCRDSMLEAPLAVDVVLSVEVARRAGRKGIQEWLSMDLKAPDDGTGSVSQA